MEPIQNEQPKHQKTVSLQCAVECYIAKLSTVRGGNLLADFFKNSNKE